MSNVSIRVMYYPESNPQGKKIGSGFLTIGELLTTRFTLFEGDNGPFIAYPSYKGQDGEWKTYVNTVNREASDYITEEVLRQIESGEANPPKAQGQKAAPKAASGRSAPARTTQRRNNVPSRGF